MSIEVERIEHAKNEPEFLTWRMVADLLAASLRSTTEYIGIGRADALEKYEWLKADDAESPMIAHARRELELVGWYEPDSDGLHPEWWAESLIAAVAEVTHYGHSGGTIGFAIGMLEDLISFKPLGPLTSNPEEWQEVTEYMDGTPCWQNRRDGRCFSYDRGQTWVNYEDPRWSKRHWWNVRTRLYRRKWNKVREKPLRTLPPEELEQP